MALSTSNNASNFFQNYLVPQESSSVGEAMQQAAQASTSNTIYESHLVSTAYAAKAVAISLFNAFSYAGAAIEKLIGHVIAMQAEETWMDILHGARDSGLSLVLGTLGVFYIAIGVLFPSAVFQYFAPVGVTESVEKQLQSQLAQLEAENRTLQGQLGDLQRQVERQLEKERRDEQFISDVEVAYKAEKKEVEIKINELSQEIRDLKASNAGLELQFQDKKQELNQLSQSKATLDAQILDLQQQKADITSQFEAKKQDCDNFSQLNDAKQTVIDDLNNQIKQKEQECTTLNQAQAQLSLELDGLKKEIQLLNDGLAGKDGEISTLRGRVTELEDQTAKQSKIIEDLKARKPSSFEVLSQEMNESEKPLSTLEAYVKKYCHPMTMEQVNVMVEKGKALGERLKAGKLEEISYAERKELMVPFIWWLMAHAANKQQAFAQGTFYLEAHQFFDFFSKADGVYTRSSSHFRRRIQPSTFNEKAGVYCYGLDFEPGLLPNGMKTVLFAPVSGLHGQKRVFFKPENYGMGTLSETVWHCVDYLYTRPAHLLPSLFGEPSGAEDRKEHIPADTKKAFLEIYQKLDNASAMPELVNLYGISGMIFLLLDHLRNNQVNSAIKTEMVTFLESLKAIDPTNLGDRTGNEVFGGNSSLLGLKVEDNSELERKEYNLLVNLLKYQTSKSAEEASKYLTEIAKLGRISESGLPLTQPERAAFVRENVVQKELLFAQLDEDLTRLTDQSGRSLVFFEIDGVKFGNGKKAQDLYEQLKGGAWLQGKEDKDKEQLVFEAMCYLQQGVRRAMHNRMQTLFTNLERGLSLVQKAIFDQDAPIAIVKIALTESLLISVTQKMELIDQGTRKPIALLNGTIDVAFGAERLEAFTWEIIHQSSI